MNPPFFVNLLPREWQPQSIPIQEQPFQIPQAQLTWYYPPPGQRPVNPYMPGEFGNRNHPLLYPRQNLNVFRQRIDKPPIYAFDYKNERLVAMEDLLPDEEQQLEPEYINY